LTGALLLAAGVLGIIVYGWLIFFFNPLLILEITAFIGVAVILGVVAWIGYTMATTPPPEPIEASTEPSKEEPSETKPSESKAE